MGQTEIVSVIKNWLAREVLLQIAPLTQEEQEACNDEKGLFKTLNKYIKPQYNETLKSLHFHKLSRQSNESMEEWMGRLRKAAVECNYQEIDRQPKEKFIHGLSEKALLAKIIRELTKCDETMTIPSELVLTWAKRIESQRAQMAVISILHEIKNFDAIMHKDGR